ncbi:MAG TPA: M23 family metallopeptidase [Vitreimonas sp.]|uniref:M23 family metallopeptidase n=1 Tax=Vitreimonas sp. TaxID=3069702 RepID=UPI002D69463C|nr:M23 family metallopeptidase [Vitreimonas sp.]HYD86204.1 M23 family metallopeptidase [Vitreimonas sp.]
MMKRPRTVFAPFVAVACFGLGVLITQVDGRARADAAPAAAETAEPVSLEPKPRLRAYAMRKASPRLSAEALRTLPVSLMVPVEGLTQAALTDTFGAARGEGRSHHGIDIMAEAGTPVLAAADGEIAKFHDSERGGVSIYQFDASGRLVFYYAHLEERAPWLEEGQEVRQGDVIGYVGMSGNAPVPHLHFEIQHRKDGRRWWRGSPVNPYPLLLEGEAPAELRPVVAEVSEADQAR